MLHRATSRSRVLSAAIVLTAVTVGVAAWAGADADGPVAALLAGGLGAGCVLGWLVLARAVPSDENAVALRQALLEERRFSERLRAHLEGMQTAHHELSSTAMATSLTVDGLVRGLKRSSSVDAAQRAVAGEVEQLVARLCEQLDQARVGRMEVWPRSRAQVGESIASAVAVVAGAHPDVQVKLELGDEAGRELAVAGGEAALSETLLELLVNACEGSGRRGARSVRVRAFVEATASALVIEIEDDGPGLTVRPPPLTSTKPERAGLGLFRVEQFAQASGGRLSLEPAEHGARARLQLPLLTRADALEEEEG